MWCCDELGLEYERTDTAGAFGFPDGFVNPNNLVPAIRDDGFELWESNAIVRYLCAKHAKGTLSPESLEHLADADRWMDWQATTQWNALRTVFWGLIRTPPEERDEKAIEAARKQTEKTWDILEAAMAGEKYVTGDTFTIADIPLGAAVHRWHALGVERENRPNVDGWYERLTERPAYIKNVVDIPLT